MFLFCFCLAILLLFLAFNSNQIQLVPIERYSTIFFAMFVSLFTDVVLGGMYDQYFYFTKGVEWKDFIFHFGFYPAISCLYLNSYPFKKDLLIKTVYVFGWSFIGFGYEQFFRYIDVFVYQDYKMGYSLIAYPILFILLRLNLAFVRMLRDKSRKGQMNYYGK